MAAGALSIPPGFAQFSFKVVSNTVGHVALFTIGGQLTSGTMTPAQGSALMVKVGAALAPIWDSTVQLTGFHALIGSDGPAGALDVSASIPGTYSGGVSFPPNVSYLFKKTTAFAGKAYRGRLFLPFVDSTSVSENGAISGAHLTRIQLAAENLFTTVSAGTDDGLSGWVLLHREVVGVTPPAPTVLTSIQATATVATQRRRLER